MRGNVFVTPAPVEPSSRLRHFEFTRVDRGHSESGWSRVRALSGRQLRRALAYHHPLKSSAVSTEQFMMKRILFAAAVAALATGCGSSRNDSTSSSSGSTGTNGTTSSGSTTGSGSTGTSGSGSSGSTTGRTCTQVADVATLRNGTPADTYVCLSSLVTVFASSYGADLDGGATKFNGNYFLADSNGNMIDVFKTKKSGPFTVDPNQGNVVNVVGTFGPFPFDGGQLEIGSKAPSVDLTSSSATVAVPVPDSATLADVSDSATSAELGRYVIVPAGTYTQDNAAPELKVSVAGRTFQDGVALVSGSNRVLVETFTFKFNNGGTSCPNDGGFPDLSTGNFHGVVDRIKGGDGALHKVVFLGGCNP
jgi:hypothetical protein